MKRIIVIATALLAVLSAAAQQKLNFEAPIRILAGSGVSPRYSSDVSVTMVPTFSKYGDGLVGLLETCHGISWDEHLFTGLGAGVSYSFYTEEIFIPVFMEGRYTLSGKGMWMPFFSLRLGGLFCTERSSNLFTINPSVGVTLKRFSFSTGYFFYTGTDKDYLPAGMGIYAWVKTPVTAHGITLLIAFSLF